MDVAANPQRVPAADETAEQAVDERDDEANAVINPTIVRALVQERQRQIDSNYNIGICYYILLTLALSAIQAYFMWNLLSDNMEYFRCEGIQGGKRAAIEAGPGATNPYFENHQILFNFLLFYSMIGIPLLPFFCLLFSAYKILENNSSRLEQTQLIMLAAFGSLLETALSYAPAFNEFFWFKGFADATRMYNPDFRQFWERAGFPLPEDKANLWKAANLDFICSHTTLLSESPPYSIAAINLLPLLLVYYLGTKLVQYHNQRVSREELRIAHADDLVRRTLKAQGNRYLAVQEFLNASPPAKLTKEQSALIKKTGEQLESNYDYLCPITGQLLIRPVTIISQTSKITSSRVLEQEKVFSHHFDYDCIKEWISKCALDSNENEMRTTFNITHPTSNLSLDAINIPDDPEARAAFIRDFPEEKLGEPFISSVSIRFNPELQERIFKHLRELDQQQTLASRIFHSLRNTISPRASAIAATSQ